ncbi:MAG: hypothetical protein RBU37_19825 [Myxococcota bacterium]|jgi:hypothetical protein|nr:hypothetical protein [Myxococcota bacterium]
MKRKAVVVDRQRLIKMGADHASEDVAQEAAAAAARWQRDISVLAQYGLGAERLAAFQALIGEHLGLMAERSNAVATKLTTVKGRKQELSNAWMLVDQLHSLLLVPARSDQALADAVNAASPADNTELVASLDALAKLVEANVAKLPKELDIAALVGQARELSAALAAKPGELSLAKAAPVSDTEQLDELEGRLLLQLGDLNDAGRKAIRAGRLQARRSEYRLQFLVKKSRRQAEKSPEPSP